MAIHKNATREEVLRKAVPYTAVELLSWSGPRMREFLYGKGGGQVPRVINGVDLREEVGRIISEWRRGVKS